MITNPTHAEITAREITRMKRARTATELAEVPEDQRWLKDAQLEALNCHIEGMENTLNEYRATLQKQAMRGSTFTYTESTNVKSKTPTASD